MTNSDFIFLTDYHIAPFGLTASLTTLIPSFRTTFIVKEV